MVYMEETGEEDDQYRKQGRGEHTPRKTKAEALPSVPVISCNTAKKTRAARGTLEGSKTN